MAFQMPHPIKDKDTGIYHLRVRVPAALKHLDTRREAVKSLRTRDPAEAKVRFAEEYAKLQKHWAALKAGPEPITLKQILALAGKVYARWMDTVANEPGEPEIWQQMLRLGHEAEAAEGGLERWYGQDVDALLADEGLVIDEHSRTRLLIAVHGAIIQASEQQLKRAQGDFSPDPKADRFPVWQDNQTGVTLTDLFEKWKTEHLSNNKAPDTVRIFEHKKDALRDYLGHEEVARITPKDVAAWCDHLRDKCGLAPKTIRDKYLTGVRTIIRLGCSKFLIESDPTAGVKVNVPKPTHTRPKGFTDEEARKILRCASDLSAGCSNMGDKNRLACQWVPWICAYTGARVGEITQLRKQDFSWQGKVPVVVITPEAGRLKNQTYRTAPMHPHLIEIGLFDFVDQAAPGYLFHDGASDAGEAIKLSRNARDKIRAWVRGPVGIVDDRVQPNHGWRHRFKTVARNAAIDIEYRDSIQGHRPRTAGEDYGDFPAEALYREICKLPRIDLTIGT